MRINAAPVVSYPATENTGVREVSALRSTGSIAVGGEPGAAAVALPEPPRQRGAVPGEPGFEERREVPRRHAERRRQKMPVMLDTRANAERRRRGRRDSDEEERSAIDVRA